MGWRRFPILWTFLLLWALAGPPRTRAVTYDYDEQNRLVRAAWANGTLIEYTYDPVGNRISRNIFSSRPPDISFEPLLNHYNGESWDSDGAIRGTAEARSGYELKRVDVSLGWMGEGGIRYWNGEGWDSPAPVWNPVMWMEDEWFYPMEKGLLFDGTYMVQARAMDMGGNKSLSDERTFTYDTIAPTREGALRIVDETRVALSFSEPVTGAAELGSYQVSGGLSVVGVTGVDETTYQLELSGAILSGSSYRITLLNIRDAAGNPMDSDFTTADFINHAPVAPGVHEPSIGAEVTNRQPELRVSNALDSDGDTLTYVFEVGEDPGFAEIIVSEENVGEGFNTTSWAVTEPLEDNHHYCWRARAWDGVFYGPWCQGDLFVNTVNDPPSTPTPTSPVDNTEVATLEPTLEIGNSEDPDLDQLLYDFEIYADAGMRILVYREEGVIEGAEGYTLCPVGNPFVDNIFYYWRVRCRDVNDGQFTSSAWSGPAGFRINTANDVPSAPEIGTPCPGDEVSDPRPLLMVRNASDVDLDPLTYFFEADRENTFNSEDLVRSSPVQEGPGAETSWHPPRDLDDNTPYYWRVRAFDGKAYGPWARGGFFVNKVNDPPGRPAILEPSGTQVSDLNPVLTAMPSQDPDLDVITYEFEVYEDEALGVLAGKGLSEETSWRVGERLFAGKVYYWRARAVDEHGLEGEWAGPAWFVMASHEEAPSAPTVNSPATGGTVVSLEAVLSVNNADHALRYDFELFSDGALKNRIDSATIDQGERITSWKPSAGLQDKETYYWRCRATNKTGTGPWMTTSSFWVSSGSVTPDVRVEAKMRVIPSADQATRIEVTRKDSPLKGACMDIPPGALKEPCDITLGLVMDPPAFPDHIKVAGRVLDLGPEGTVFNKPVTVIFPVTKEDMEEAGVDDLSLLKVFTFVHKTLSWEEIPAAGVDNEALLIFFKVDHFSLFTIGRSTVAGEEEDVESFSVSGSGCFVTEIGRGGRSALEGLLLGTLAFAGILTVIFRLKRRRRAGNGKKALLGLLFPVILLVIGAGEGWATSSDISASGNEGEILLSASAVFTDYGGDPSGTLSVYHDTSRMTQFAGIGSATWSTTLDGGALSQGEHVFSAVAVDSQGYSHTSTHSIIIDNRPEVTVDSPGDVEGEFDITGTAEFKEHVGGEEGTVYISINTTDWRKRKSKICDGTSIHWSYSEIAGSELDAGSFNNGEQSVYVFATAANGTSSETVVMKFGVDNTPEVRVQDAGKVEGAFDVTGTATFKPYAGGEEGYVEIYVDTTDWRKARGRKSYEGTDVSWSYSELSGAMLDGGEWANGGHTVYVKAKAANGAWSEWATGTFDIDNTPEVTIRSPGARQGSVDLVGTVDFKEYLGGPEGSIHFYANSQSWRNEIGSKTYEGTHVTWRYSDIAGQGLDISTWNAGSHKIYVKAMAHNGASSWAETDLVVIGENNLNDEKNMGAGAGACETRPRAGDPINFAVGNTYRRERDVGIKGPGLPMVFHRHYNSRSDHDGPLGFGWRGTFSDRITDQGDALLLTRADGMALLLVDNGQGEYVSETDRVLRVVRTDSGYVLEQPGGERWFFDGDGNLTEIRDRRENKQVVFYEQGRLKAVADNFGRRLDFSYNEEGRLSRILSPAGEYALNYDGSGNLTDVIYPDGKAKSYVYEDPNDPHNLTGIINENGVQFVTYAYDSQDRAVFFSYPGGKEKIEVVYGPGTQRKLIDSLGREKLYDLHVDNGIGRIKAVSGTGCGSCPSAGGSAYDLDDRLRIQVRTDAAGKITEFIYDDRGNLLERLDAVGTPEERFTAYTYHEDFNLVTSMMRESLAGGEDQESTTNFLYDEKGNLLSRTETGFVDGEVITRKTGYTYDAEGQITRVDGSRTDIQDITSLAYYPNTSDQGRNRGMLKQIQNALGHEISFSDYNGFGYPQRTVDANGVITTYEYDMRGRLVSKTVDGRETRYAYDGAGNLLSVMDPGGGMVRLTYNEADDLIRVEDRKGNALSYAYDTEGNRVLEENRDPGGALKRFVEYGYNDLDRIAGVLYPDGASEQMTYDESGNLLSRIDGNGRETAYAYDLLGRLRSVTLPGNATTGYDYDRHDNLASVTDAKNNTTTYVYDDFGRLISTDSPDTNTTAYGYDEAGNLVSRTDGRGIPVSYGYDALNRLIEIGFPDASENIGYGYDEGEGQKGYLTSMIDPAGRTEYTYNTAGQLVEETRVMEGISYRTRYGVDDSSNLVGVTYPSGLVVEYERDESGNIASTRVDGEPLTSSVSHLPFGPVASLALGDDLLTVTRTYDRRYQLTGISAGSVMDYQYTRDPVGNILSISGVTEPMPEGGPIFYDYEGNQLRSRGGLEWAEYDHDGHGNMISDGIREFVYNGNNRLIRVIRGTEILGEYSYDGHGRRVKKTASGKTTCFHYDPTGNLIAETASDGTPLRDYIYQDGERVAMKIYGDQEGTYYFLNDHLGTPHIIINTTGEIVWHAAYLPFGQAEILKETITNNLRFPGQYFDEETGLHYNYFRYYDPETGRYLTRDPVGITSSQVDILMSIDSSQLSSPCILSLNKGKVLLIREIIKQLLMKNPQLLNSYIYCANNSVNSLDRFGLYLTPEQKIITSIAGGSGALLGGLVGTYVFPGVGTAVGAAIGSSLFSAAAVSLQGGNMADVLNAAVTGLTIGYIGAGIGNLMMVVSRSGIQAAVRAGLLSGSLEVVAMEAAPIIEGEKVSISRCEKRK